MLTSTEKDDRNSDENVHTWSDLPNPGVSSYAQVSFLLESKGRGELSKGTGLSGSVGEQYVSDRHSSKRPSSMRGTFISYRNIC